MRREGGGEEVRGKGRGEGMSGREKRRRGKGLGEGGEGKERVESEERGAGRGREGVGERGGVLEGVGCVECVWRECVLGGGWGGVRSRCGRV